MNELTKTLIDELKAKHGELRGFVLEQESKIPFQKLTAQKFVVRGPSPAEYQRAVDKISDGGRRKIEAIFEIGEACLVFPEASEIAKIAAAKPGLLMTAGNEAMQIAGMVDAYAEKL